MTWTEEKEALWKIGLIALIILLAVVWWWCIVS